MELSGSQRRGAVSKLVALVAPPLGSFRFDDVFLLVRPTCYSICPTLYSSCPTSYSECLICYSECPTFTVNVRMEKSNLTKKVGHGHKVPYYFSTRTFEKKVDHWGVESQSID